ncbi:hypothetical protein KFE25_009494 [Diacronema lutheri]|uniref:Uncharacterized protein n=1 Tax=Diacronema lutheri TaxID=2081491 RepID=A0A8J5XSV6_DIALT|nr:hypothetical protein KFE25_009494 [Diacronema lutheri]
MGSASPGRDEPRPGVRRTATESFPDFAARSVNLFDNNQVTVRLTLGAPLCYALLLALSFWYASDHVTALKPEEAVAAGAAAAVLWSSVALKAIEMSMHTHRTPAERNISLVIMSVHVIAATSNLILATVPMPIVIDPIIGVRQHLARWA